MLHGVNLQFIAPIYEESQALVRFHLRLSENAHLPFDRLTVLSNVEGLRYPHPLPC